MATLAMLQVKLRDLKTPKSDFFHRIMVLLPTLFSGIRCRLLNGFSCFLPSPIRPTPESPADLDRLRSDSDLGFARR